jgi:hypothetical protein
MSNWAQKEKLNNPSKLGALSTKPELAPIVKPTSSPAKGTLVCSLLFYLM